MNDFERDPAEQPMRARPYGASPVAISIAVLVLVAALVGAGALLILNQGDDDGGQAGVGTATATEQNDAVATGTQNEDEPTATTVTPEGDDLTPTEDGATPTEPTPSVTETENEDGELEPTATEPDPEPTEPEPTGETSQVTPTPEPIVGDFGQLPPAQLPSGGASSALELNYQLGMSLEALPGTASVYLIDWPVLSLDEAEAVAQRFGLQAEVVEEGVGIYRVDSGQGSLFISPGETIYRAADPDTDGELPDDTTIIDAARDWLILSGFAGNDIDSGSVVGRDDEIGRAVVAFRPSSPAPILAPTPSATITIGADGALIEARISWPANLIPSDYGLHAPIDLWRAVESGQGFVEADLSGVDTTQGLTGTATISDYSIAYTLAGNPSGDQYLVPVISFHGVARLDRTGDEIDITVSVPAVYAEIGSIG